jgi:phosphatidylserine decarboxylase
MPLEARMVRDGYWYGISLFLVAAVVRILTAGWFASWVLVAIPVLLALFFLWFFRDPARTIPDSPGLVVSPADGKVTEVAPIRTQDGDRIRLSIFLSVFDVHVNRAPIEGVIRRIEYRKGEYLNALDPASAERNEQSVITMEGYGCIITFKLIAGLLARRIVLFHQEGARLQRGERIGLIKFGSRCDLLLPGDAHVRVERGQHVKGGETILADVEVPSSEPTLPAEVMETRG